MSPMKPATNHTSNSLHEPVKIMDPTNSFAEIEPQTIPDFFHKSCQKYKDLPALVFKRSSQDIGSSAESDAWISITYEDYENNVEQAALALLYLGVPPRTSVGILGVNSPEWFYLHLAAIHINAVSAGIYTTNSAEAVFHVLHTSDASVVVVDDSHQMSKIRAIKSRLPQLRAVIQLNGPFDFVEEDTKEGYYRWSDLMRMKFSLKLRNELFQRIRKVAPNDCAFLIFTSGTVGLPKGVMVSHDAALYSALAVSQAISSLQPPGQETIVCYLPLNHIAAQFFDIFMGMVNGSTIYFADRNALKGSLGETLVEARPTMFLGVPRVFEKIREQQLKMEANSSAVMRRLTSLAKTIMMQHHLDQMAGKPTSFVKYYLASPIIQRIKVALGLDRTKFCSIGGAPVSEDLKCFFLSLDMPLTDSYGMSESSGIMVYDFENSNLASVGKPVNGLEVKIYQPKVNGEGEILVRGRSNFMGYLKEPQKTKETITEDGWILTGDSGFMDAKGNLYVNGRIKELIITSGGENMSPNYIEDLIKKELPCISNVIAIGDCRKYVTALLTFKTHMDPDTGYPLDTLLPEVIEWLASLNLHYTKLSEMLHFKFPKNLKDFDPNSVNIMLDYTVQMALDDGIKEANKHALSNAQKVQYFAVLPHDFSVPTGELGPTLKSRRNVIHKKYAPIINKMYKN